MAWSNTGHVPPATKRRILKRDNNTCQRCGAQGVTLEINHRNNTRGFGYSNDDNLEALCRPCHATQTRRETQEGQRKRRAQGMHPGDKHPAYY